LRCSSSTSDQRQIAAAADEARERFGRVDRLINNAGVMGSPSLVRLTDSRRSSPPTISATSRSPAGCLQLSWRARERGWSRCRACRHVWGASDGTTSSVSAPTTRSGRTRSPSWPPCCSPSSFRRGRGGWYRCDLRRRPSGFASTEIGAARSGDAIRERGTRAGIGIRLVPCAAEAAGPSLRAATSPDAYGGQYYGPSGTGGVKGAPVALPAPRRALDERARQLLWERSVELTGVDFPLVPPLQLRRNE
jgi:hypothetical protein